MIVVYISYLYCPQKYINTSPLRNCKLYYVYLNKRNFQNKKNSDLISNYAQINIYKQERGGPAKEFPLELYLSAFMTTG